MIKNIRRQRDREHHAQSALQADMAIIDDGQQDLDVLPPGHNVLFQKDLERAAQGEIPLKPLTMHKSVEQMVTAFLKRQFSQVLRTAEWHGQNGTTNFRKQYPISLAWALTTWKAQGITCLGKVYAPFPSSERQAGLTYVNLSRLTEWSKLCIGKAIPLDRLTTKISSCKGMEERIAEDSRLRGLWDSAKAFYNRSRQ